ncbi:PolC-type DNA polymerase III [Ruoffia tabacinasalis]|uniref:DNA polymerase III PolC-type n=1 Tax=Ruoffia tabacinasalis TaxID=87458 RepID=A0A5R9DTT8_9LACT|nr:PolC-type DNA polymerase III [Ruoffia tabacinasalis]TLQ40487.1 PolC-type DNA polymerase III [Ruoffia tabacinasalis]
MADKRELFELLLEHIQLNDEEIVEELQHTEIETVNILAQSNQWHFTFTSPNRIHPNVYQIFQHHILKAFEHIGKVETWWLFEEDSLETNNILEYWYAIMSVIAQEKPFIRSILSQAKYEIVGESLRIGLASDIQINMLKEKYERLLLEKLEQVQITDLNLEYYVDEELLQDEINAVRDRQSTEDERSLLEALEIQEKRQKQERTVVQSTSEDIGKDIPNKPALPMIELEDNQFKQIIEGFIFSHEIKDLRSGNQLLIMNITDYTSSVTVKLMSGRRISKEALNQFSKGEWIRLEGDMIPDNFTSELYFRPRSVRKVTVPGREDKAPADEKRVELHAHTNMSQLDATNSATDIVTQAAKWGHKAVAITDHAVAQAFPDAYWAGKKHGIKVIYGIEAYVVNDGEPIAFNLRDEALDEATYVVFDVETTGLSSVYDDIIELAGVKMREGEIIDTFEAFINPNKPLSAFTTELTGITDDMVKDAPTAKPVLEQFQQFCGDSILVAHNATFDIGFINKGYERVGLPQTDLPVIDTLELSRLVNPEYKSHRLNTLAKRYNVQLEQHHRAVYDSETTGYILMKLLEQAKDQFGIVNHNQLNDQIGQGESYKQSRPFHATLLVKNQDGLKALFKLISMSSTEYFYRVPRIPRSVLTQYRDDLLIGTACSTGEVFTAMMQKGYEEASELVDYYDFIEVQPPSVYEPLIKDDLIRNEPDLKHIISEMLRLGDEKNKTVVATGNVHYLDEKDAIYREVLKKSMKINANRTLHMPKVHFRTTDEMLHEFAFLGAEKAQEIVVENSQKIADSIEEVAVIKDELYPPVIEGAEEEITQMSYDKAHEMYGNPLPDIVDKRIKKELDSIISNGFAVIYLISQKLVLKSNDDGYLVGSRGSVGSSLVATLTGITEVNPLAAHYYCTECHYSEFFTNGEHKSGYDLPPKACPDCGAELKKDGQDIPFETFLGFYGDKVPDIDLNFSGDYQAKAHAYTKELFGEDYVFRAGTIGTVANKTAHGYIRGYLESSGEHLPQAERERLAYGIEGARRTTGQHPGGIIVIPDFMDVYDFTPVQYPADDVNAEWKTTHFDFHSIDANVLKLDILGHDDPTMIRMLQDLSGIDPMDIPPVDEKVMQIFSGTEVLGVTPEQINSDTGTLGVPEFGTGFVRGMVSETKPKTFAELLQISGLSHGTDVWLGNAQELIKNNVVELSDVIGCRDDIMTTLIQYGLEDGTAFQIMEHVRKGKGIPDEWQADMRSNNVPEWYIDSCLKIKYMFPKAHAAAYVLMALRVAYFKVYYPMYYYAAYFSIRAKDFDLVAMHQGKEMVKRRVREINDKGFGATNKEKELVTELEIANEMLERGFKFQMINIEKSDSKHFIIEGDSLIPPFRAVPGLGNNVAEQIVKARQEAPFLSKEDLQKRGKVSKTVLAYLDDNGVLEGLPDEDQLSLF